MKIGFTSHPKNILIFVSLTEHFGLVLGDNYGESPLVIGKERKYDEVKGCLFSGGGMSSGSVGLGSNTTTSSHQLSAWYGTDRYHNHLQTDSINKILLIVGKATMTIIRQEIIWLPLQ